MKHLASLASLAQCHEQKGTRWVGACLWEPELCQPGVEPQKALTPAPGQAAGAKASLQLTAAVTAKTPANQQRLNIYIHI